MGPDAPLSPRGRSIFYGTLLAIAVVGLVLLAISRWELPATESPRRNAR